MKISPLIYILIGLALIAAVGYGIWVVSNQQGQPVSPTTNYTTPTTTVTYAPTSGPTAASLLGPLTVTLTAQNNSGESGTAVLESQAGGKTKVTLNLTGAPKAPQPAHIHVGSCPTPGAVKYPLNNVINGKSTSVIDVALDALKSLLPLAVNVHKSATEASVYVSCGNLTF